MNDRPHFFKRYGYWHCRNGGLTGAGYSMAQAFESLQKVVRFWRDQLNLTDVT